MELRQHCYRGELDWACSDVGFVYVKYIVGSERLREGERKARVGRAWDGIGALHREACRFREVEILAFETSVSEVDMRMEGIGWGTKCGEGFIRISQPMQENEDVYW